jgi:hypothetical protein
MGTGLRRYGEFVKWRPAAVLLMAGLVLAWSAYAAGAACLKPDIERAAQQVHEVRHAMLASPVADMMTTNVPPEAQRLIAAMKARLGDLADAYMHCAPAQADAKRFEHDLVELARGTDPDPTDDDRYGGRIDFDVRVTAGPPQLASIVASFSIHCGGDAALFVFARQADDWREALRWEARDYKDVGGAFWSFDYAISPPDQAGRWYVVTKNVAPWCSSTWSAIRYSVLRSRVNTHEPAQLLHGEDSIWWGNEDFGIVSARQNDFEVRFHAGSINTGVHNRLFIRHFGIEGDRIWRSQPVAESARDFVDEWIVSPWSLASQWTAAQGRQKLEERHRFLLRSRWAGWTFDEEEQPPAGTATQWVALSSDDFTFHFEVAVNGDHYEMRRIWAEPAKTAAAE